MNIGAVIALCLGSGLLGAMIADAKASEYHKRVLDEIFKDNQENIKFLVNKIVEVRKNGSAKMDDKSQNGGGGA